MKGVKNVFALLSLGSMLILVGCGFGNLRQGKEGPEQKMEYVYALSEEATALEVSGGVDVIVDSTLAKNQILVHTDAANLDNLVIKEEGGKLIISRKSKKAYTEYKLYVPAFDYKALAVSGGVDLKWYYCAVNDLAVAVSGGADCVIKGHCDTLKVAVSGGADVDFEELFAEDVIVSSSGGADAYINAIKTIAVNASGGSDVYLTGNPQIVECNVSGGADFHIKKW